MDGVSHYVTVRRDIYTGLVSASTTIPVTTLASTSIITNNKPKPDSPTGILIDPSVKTRIITPSQISDKSCHHDCSLCAKTFASKALLNRHLKTHSLVLQSSPSSSPTETISLLKCEHPGCSDRTFPSQVALMKHMKGQHHQVELENQSIEVQVSREQATKRHPGEKRFQCGQCNKRFPTSKDLKRHEVVHTGNRDFQCSFCSHRFGRKDHRMRHEKKTHANELLSPISPPSNVNNNNKLDTHVKTSSGVSLVPITQASGEEQLRKQRWRHVSTPSFPSSSPASQSIEMTDLPVRIRAMSTCDHPTRSRKTDAPLYDESSLKYLESQLSPESLLVEDPRMSPDFSVKSEDTSDSSKSNNLDWIMSEFMIKSEEPLEVASVASAGNPNTQPEIIAAPSSPEPEPSSLSPPLGFFKEEKEKLSDILTRTKNPVLPSVYIDNSLIVPEPSKQKYHNPAPLLSPEDIDLDYYEAFMDDKDIAETLFHV